MVHVLGVEQNITYQRVPRLAASGFAAMSIAVLIKCPLAAFSFDLSKIGKYDRSLHIEVLETLPSSGFRHEAWRRKSR